MSKIDAPKASQKPANPARKLFIGPRFRRLRRQLGLSQTQMAEEIGISASYVNLIERNQRPVTAQILVKMAETYDIDLRDLAFFLSVIGFALFATGVIIRGHRAG